MSHCRRCETSMLHCHGTLVRHEDGVTDCSEVDCAGEVAVHEFLVTCAEIGNGCCQQMPLAAGRRPRSPGHRLAG